LSDCSSIRSRPSSVSHSRPLAPCSSGSAPWPVKSEESIRLSVKVMSALIPATWGAPSADHHDHRDEHAEQSRGRCCP
jgi:hypothetical protein